MKFIKKFFLRLFLKLLRIFPPETSSYISLKFLKIAFSANNNILKSNFTNSYNSIVFEDLKFIHPVGLAAGLDKEAKYFDALGSIGFSFIEVGTFTPEAQKGNKRPRVKRITKHNSLINRLGFNNPGINEGIQNIHLYKKNFNGILGVSIGKNKETSLEEAHEDYIYCLKKSYEVADYIAINISSPNTKDLRKLSSKNYIDYLVKQISEEANDLEKTYQKKTPLLLKLSPDEEESNIEHIISSSLEGGISGFIISNSMSGNFGNIQGGVTGKLLKDKSLRLLKKVKKIIPKNILIISSGGISDKQDLNERLDNGARLIQIYTSFVYKGPEVLEDLLN